MLTLLAVEEVILVVITPQCGRGFNPGVDRDMVYGMFLGSLLYEIQYGYRVNGVKTLVL